MRLLPSRAPCRASRLGLRSPWPVTPAGPPADALSSPDVGIRSPAVTLRFEQIRDAGARAPSGVARYRIFIFTHILHIFSF